MKAFGFFLGLIFFTSAFSQSSQQNDFTNNQSALNANKLVAAFNMPVLTPSYLQAFENRGIQKIRDYLDFIAIISDKSYDTTLRKYSIAQAEKLFDNPFCMVTEKLDVKTNQKNSADAFFKRVYSTNCEKIKTGMSDAQIKQHLVMNKDSVYTGSVTIKQSMAFYDQQGKVQKTVVSNKTVSLVVRRTPKTFGKDNMLIWEVAIRGIE
jgi:hypothetical protein